MNDQSDSHIQAGVERQYSPRIVRYFGRYLRNRFFPGTFHAVRVMGGDRLPSGKARPIVAFMNHSSWWDPITGMILNVEFFPDRRAFAPMDAKMLEKYAFMSRIGLFPVERDARRGAAEFVRTARAILSKPDCVLGLTPQGEFADVRQRPLAFKPGIAHLARDCPHALFLPIAVEQVFWNEKKPELLVNLGTVIDPASQPDNSVDVWNIKLERALERVMDELAEAAMARDPDRFETLLLAKTGTSRTYDLARRVKALARGGRFSPTHGEENK